MTRVPPGSTAVREGTHRRRTLIAHVITWGTEYLERQPEQALASFRRIGIGELSLAGQAKAEYSLGHVQESQRLLQQLIDRYGNKAAD